MPRGSLAQRQRPRQPDYGYGYRSDGDKHSRVGTRAGRTASQVERGALGLVVRNPEC